MKIAEGDSTFHKGCVHSTGMGVAVKGFTAVTNTQKPKGESLGQGYK